MKNFYQKGISFLEIIIVVAIIGILSAIVMPQFSKIKNAQIIKSASEDVLSVLNKARAQTLASLNSQQYGVRFETNRVIIFIGTIYDANSASNEIINISLPATISNISLTGGSTEVYFNRLNGTPSKTGTITISIASDSSYTKVVTISGVGGASLN